MTCDLSIEYKSHLGLRILNCVTNLDSKPTHEFLKLRYNGIECKIAVKDTSIHVCARTDETAFCMDEETEVAGESTWEEIVHKVIMEVTFRLTAVACNQLIFVQTIGNYNVN